jgi:hypothetical protein
MNKPLNLQKYFLLENKEKINSETISNRQRIHSIPGRSTAFGNNYLWRNRFVFRLFGIFKLATDLYHS